MKYTYLLLNIFTISIPFIFSFHKKLNFYKTWIALFPAVIITAAVFIIWDIWFTNMGVWGFNPAYLIGVDIVNLPLEEWLFFFCIPYAIVFTYASIKKLVKSDILSTKTITPIVIKRLITGRSNNPKIPIKNIHTRLNGILNAQKIVK